MLNVVKEPKARTKPSTDQSRRGVMAGTTIKSMGILRNLKNFRLWKLTKANPVQDSTTASAAPDFSSQKKPLKFTKPPRNINACTRRC